MKFDHAPDKTRAKSQMRKCVQGVNVIRSTGEAQKTSTVGISSQKLREFTRTAENKHLIQVEWIEPGLSKNATF